MGLFPVSSQFANPQPDQAALQNPFLFCWRFGSRDLQHVNLFRLARLHCLGLRRVRVQRRGRRPPRRRGPPPVPSTPAPTRGQPCFFFATPPPALRKKITAS